VHWNFDECFDTNVSGSFFEPMEDDTTLPGVVSNESEHNCHGSVDSDCDMVATSSLDSNVAPCEQIHKPTSTVTPLEKQQYLQYIVDTVCCRTFSRSGIFARI